jgi:hypothetical protein
MLVRLIKYVWRCSAFHTYCDRAARLQNVILSDYLCTRSRADPTSDGKPAVVPIVSQMAIPTGVCFTADSGSIVYVYLYHIFFTDDEMIKDDDI